MKETIFTLVERCVGCKSCEIACAVAHSESKVLATARNEAGRPRARVRVEPAGNYSFPSRCMHCEDAACISACPTGAMARDSATGTVQVDRDRCIGCWMCVSVCPFGGVTADPTSGTAHKCDLCPDRTARGLEPACVEACPTGAMVFATPEEFADDRRRVTALSTIGIGGEVPENIALWRLLRGGNQR